MKQDVCVTVSEDEYYRMLEILPPACMMVGGFLVGEPFDHVKGIPRYDMFTEVGGMYINRGIRTIEDFRKMMVNMKKTVQEIKKMEE